MGVKKNGGRGNFPYLFSDAKKRGQLTLFIIVAVVLVFLIIGYYFLKYGSDSDDVVNTEVRVVYDIVLSCVNGVTEQSLEDIGVAGGYFDLPKDVSEFYIAYYYNQKNVMPSIDTIEKEIAKYNEQMLYFCLEEEYSRLADFEVYSGDIDVTVDINPDDRVYINVDYPFSVSKENRTYSFSDGFKVEKDVRLYTIYSFIEKLISWHENNPRAMCVNCISDEAFRQKLYVNVIDETESDVVYFVEDPESIVNGASYRFYFVIKPERGGIYDTFENL